MAANVPFTGYVANYYQLYNQGFTPFTWIYYVLSWWQTASARARWSHPGPLARCSGS